MGGRGGNRKPSKPYEETFRGKRDKEKQENEERREENLRKKVEKKDLWEKNLCKGPDGQIRSFAETGRKYGHLGIVAGQQGIVAGQQSGYLGAPSGHLGASKGHLGAKKGKESYEKASNLQKQRWTAAASIGGSAAWAKHSSEKQSEIQQAGVLGSLNSADYCRDVGRYNYILEASQAELLRIDKGREHSAQVRTDKAEERYAGDGPPPPVVPNNGVWNCNGFLDDNNNEACKFECAKKVDLMSFVNATDLVLLKWLINHNLLEPDCNRDGCDGVACRPIALGNEIGLKCDDCGYVSKGALRGFWSKGRLGLTKMVMVVFAVVTGMSLVQFRKYSGVKINKNTWTRYVKDIGMVCAEDLERDRRDPNRRFWNAQYDESAFGNRKYERGKRVRLCGVQWALSCVDVDPDTGKTKYVDIQFLSYNKRNTKNIVPLVVQRMMPGGTITTDMWKVYPRAAEAAGCQHLTVNHSKCFKDPDTGVHTNNVEGIHGTIKRSARSQFGRLPSLSDDGFTNYLDLLVWKANVGLKKEKEFYGWCKTLFNWTKNPIEDFDHTIPVWEEDPVVEGEEGGKGDKGDGEVDSSEEDDGEAEVEVDEEIEGYDWFNKEQEIDVIEFDNDVGFNFDGVGAEFNFSSE